MGDMVTSKHSRWQKASVRKQRMAVTEDRCQRKQCDRREVPQKTMSQKTGATENRCHRDDECDRS